MAVQLGQVHKDKCVRVCKRPRSMNNLGTTCLTVHALFSFPIKKLLKITTNSRAGKHNILGHFLSDTHNLVYSDTEDRSRDREAVRNIRYIRLTSAGVFLCGIKFHLFVH